MLRQYEVPWPWRWHVQSYPILVSLRYETGRIFQNPRNKNTLERKTWKIVDNFGNFKNNQIENDPLLCGKTPLLERIREQWISTNSISFVTMEMTEGLLYSWCVATIFSPWLSMYPLITRTSDLALSQYWFIRRCLRPITVSGYDEHA